MWRRGWKGNDEVSWNKQKKWKKRWGKGENEKRKSGEWDEKEKKGKIIENK